MCFCDFIKRDYKIIFSKAWLWITIAYGILSLVLWWISPDQFLSGNASIWMRLLLALTVLLIFFLLTFLFVGFYLFRKEKVLIFKTNKGHKVFAQYGNVLDKNIVEKQQRHITVIPVNRCFDTIVDDDLISENTLHGVFMKSLYESEGCKYDSESLNGELQQYLKKHHPNEGEELKLEDKRKGNLSRYPVGTIVELDVSENDKYFLLGLSKFNSQLQASTSREEFVLAILRLVDFCYSRSQGYSIIIPLFGKGLSRVDISNQEALNFIVNFFKMNMNHIVCDIHIVVDVEKKGDVSIYT